MELPRWTRYGIILDYDKSDPTYIHHDVVSLDFSSPTSRSVDVFVLESVCPLCTGKPVFSEFMGAGIIE